MLAFDEIIRRRRSIRKFKADTVAQEHVEAIIEAARLAPSGCNMQPWRFKIVRDNTTKHKLVQACYGQEFIAKAPVVIVCCADIGSYNTGTLSAVTDYGRNGPVEENALRKIFNKMAPADQLEPSSLIPGVLINVAIAIEHMVLKAVDLGLGSCWVRLLDEHSIRSMFAWGPDLCVVAVLPIGYPDGTPPAKERLPLDRILLD